VEAKAVGVDATILAEASRLEREYPMQKIEPAQFEDLFEQRLSRYDAEQAMVVEEQEEQTQLMYRLDEANKVFLAARKGDSSSKAREQALQKLEGAYFKYREIVANLDGGRKFYNDLAKIVGRFRDECKSFVYQRRLEATQMES
jgi:programmed cell death 6-interacting protein